MDKQKLREKIEALEKQIAELKEELDKPEVPFDFTPVWEPAPFPTWPPPAPEWSRCPKCNIQLTGVMMYVCGFNDCPTGLGGTRC